jgi:outer membrane cobalamin receptor
VLQEDVKAIAEVIVTALGLERNYADLTYSADKIRGAQLTAVKDPNLILSLSGKSAGVQVNKNSSGAGASAKVSIRGVRSVASRSMWSTVCPFSIRPPSRPTRP